MNRKLIGLLAVLLLSAFCLSIVSAENNTAEPLENDNTNYIQPISFSETGIEFSDGFTGFCLDSAKDEIASDDGFIGGPTTSNKTENYVKLAIIECYKQKKENEIGAIVAKIVANDLDSDNSVIGEVMNSPDTPKDHEVVMIDNDTEATFDFELLKSSSENVSDCLAYIVSLKTVDNAEEPLGAPADDGDNNIETDDNTDNNNANSDNNIKTENNADDGNNVKTEDNTDDNNNANSDNNVKTEDNVNTEDRSQNEQNQNTTGETNKNPTDSETHETNKTIINKTNTVIVNEKNTTVINKNNVKTVNETSKQTPHDNTTEDLLKKAGNPIFILIVVVAIIIVAAVVMNRKD